MSNLSHVVKIEVKDVTGNGDLAGFKTVCSCGDTSSWSFRSMAEAYARDHVAFMAAKPAPKKARRKASRPSWMPALCPACKLSYTDCSCNVA